MNQTFDTQAKVGSSADEIRSLLERCLAAESELDRSKSNVLELRRKLDDSQAALHELGRENQSIQVCSPLKSTSSIADPQQKPLSFRLSWPNRRAENGRMTQRSTSAQLAKMDSRCKFKKIITFYLCPQPAISFTLKSRTPVIGSGLAPVLPCCM